MTIMNMKRGWRKSPVPVRPKWFLAGIGTAFLIMMVVLGAILVFNQTSTPEEEEPDTVVVPNFVGKVYTSEIEGNEELYVYLFIKEGNDPEQDIGVVLKQTPNEGLEVKKGKEITLTVNQEGDAIPVPRCFRFLRGSGHEQPPESGSAAEGHLCGGR